jgi:hypothetical protein
MTTSRPTDNSSRPTDNNSNTDQRRRLVSIGTPLGSALGAAHLLDVGDTRRCGTGLRSWAAVNAVVGKLVGAQLGSAFGDKLGEVLGETKIGNGARSRYWSRCWLARRNGIGSGTAL